MQVAMETVDIQAVYEFILPVSEIESLSNVSLKFLNENELKSFLGNEEGSYYKKFNILKKSKIISNCFKSALTVDNISGY